MSRALKLGDVVTVGPAYRMGGTYHDDAPTGATMRVCRVCPGGDYGLTHYMGPEPVDHGDADWYINGARLLPASYASSPGLRRLGSGAWQVTYREPGGLHGSETFARFQEARAFLEELLTRTEPSKPDESNQTK